MPDKVSDEKIELLKAYGAEVVITPTSVPRESPESFYSVADRLTREIPGAFQPNQFFNPANPAAHYATTGPEIWEQTDGTVDVLVSGLGTGGTITGAGRYLKEQKPGLLVVGADPEGSIFSGDTSCKPYKVEGVGQSFIPGTADLDDRGPLGAGQRPRCLPDGAPHRPRGGPAGRRLLRTGPARRAAGLPGAG